MERGAPLFAFDTKRVQVHAWAEEATEATVSLQNVSGAAAVKLEIPLDSALPIRTKKASEQNVATEAPSRGVPRPAREPLRRDSLKRREALLKGKEGSRRRQRWENDRLLSNPWAQPPEPSDWNICPTYPQRAVPYFLAPLWDIEIAARKEAEQKRRIARARAAAGLANVKNEAVGHVPRELRQKLKRAKGAKQMLHDLEEEVRSFVLGWTERQNHLARAGLHDVDSEEEEIVFVGRNGQMHDLPPSPKRAAHEDLFSHAHREKLMIDSAVDDRSATFGRWLVHSIATYYGLNTWSVTVGSRREAYIGIKPAKAGKPAAMHLPQPLWGII